MKYFQSQENQNMPVTGIEKNWRKESCYLQPFVTYRVSQIYLSSHSLTTFSGSLCPGRYFTFSWSLFMMSVSFLPLTVSSKTHILTVEANFCSFLTLLPIIFATAEPLQKISWRRKKLSSLGQKRKRIQLKFRRPVFQF
jgi:hypothetical protein